MFDGTNIKSVFHTETECYAFVLGIGEAAEGRNLSCCDARILRLTPVQLEPHTAELHFARSLFAT